MKNLFKILILSLLVFSCDKDNPTDSSVHGCFDFEACNYDPEANIDNNSCWYSEDTFCPCSYGPEPIISDCFLVVGYSEEYGCWFEEECYTQEECDDMEGCESNECEEVEECGYVQIYDINETTNGKWQY